MSSVKKRIQLEQERQQAAVQSRQAIERERQLEAIAPRLAQNGNNLAYIQRILGTTPTAVVEHLSRTRIASKLRNSFTMGEYIKGFRDRDETKFFTVATTSGGWLLKGAFEHKGSTSNTCHGEYPSAEPTYWTSRGDLLLTSAGVLYKPGQFYKPFGSTEHTLGVVEGTGTPISEALPTAVTDPAQALSFFEGINREASHSALSAKLYEIATSGVAFLDGSNFIEL